MHHINYIHVPFIAAYPIGSYSEGILFGMSPSGRYVQAAWAADDFEQYATGLRFYFSGSGFWSNSGFSFSVSNFNFIDYNVSPTGFISGFGGLTGYTGFLYYPIINLTGKSYTFDNFWYQDFDFSQTGNYITGNYITGAQKIQGYSQILSPTSGHFYTFDNFWYQDFDAYATGDFTTGLLNKSIFIDAYYQKISDLTGKCYYLIPNLGALGGTLNYLEFGPKSSNNEFPVNPMKSLFFDSGYGNFPHISIPTTFNTGFLLNDFTVEFWAKRSGWLAGSDNRFVDKNNINGFSINRNITSDNINFEILNQVCTSTNTISDNIWTHIGCVRSGSNAYIYISGKLDSGPFNVGNTQLSSIDSLTLGMNNSTIIGAQPFAGYISEFRLYNYARNSGEIYAWTGVQIPNPLSLPQLLVYFQF